MSEKIIELVQHSIHNKELVTFIVSMLPIVELRAAIPLGILYYKLNFIKVYVISILGNLIPVYPILYLLIPVMNLFSRTRIGQKFYEKLEKKAEKNREKILKYEITGLLVFVAIPLPGTGAWTGAMIAALLKLNPHKSFLSISIGVLISGVVVTVFSLLGIWGAVAAGIILIISTVKALQSRTAREV